MTEEQWRAIPGYEGFYEVSDRGRVRCLDRTVWRGNIPVSRRGRVLRAATTARGRRTVTLHKNGHRRTGHVSQMVMEAFVGPCPPGLFVCHNDGEAANDALSNLRYDTPRANNLDTLKHGRNPYALKPTVLGITRTTRRTPTSAPGVSALAVSVDRLIRGPATNGR